MKAEHSRLILRKHAENRPVTKVVY